MEKTTDKRFNTEQEGFDIYEQIQKQIVKLEKENAGKTNGKTKNKEYQKLAIKRNKVKKHIKK